MKDTLTILEEIKSQIEREQEINQMRFKLSKGISDKRRSCIEQSKAFIKCWTFVVKAIAIATPATDAGTNGKEE